MGIRKSVPPPLPFTRVNLGNSNMKKLVIALAAVAAFTGSASAADMAVKARPAPPPPPPVANWTGCYIAGSVGYGLFDNESSGSRFRDTTGAVFIEGAPVDFGGRGWLAGGGGGCDYQFGFGGGGGFFRTGPFWSGGLACGYLDQIQGERAGSGIFGKRGAALFRSGKAQS